MAYQSLVPDFIMFVNDEHGVLDHFLPYTMAPLSILTVTLIAALTVTQIVGLYCYFDCELTSHILPLKSAAMAKKSDHLLTILSGPMVGKCMEPQGFIY